MPSRNHPPPIRQWYRYRVAALFALALYSFRFGLAYTPLLEQRRLPSALTVITAVLPQETDHWQPVWALGGIWLGVGVLSLAAVGFSRLHNATFIAGTAFSLYWCSAYFFADNGPGKITDLYTGVFLICAAVFIALLGLLTRPGAVPTFEEHDTSPVEHRVR